MCNFHPLSQAGLYYGHFPTTCLPEELKTKSGRKMQCHACLSFPFVCLVSVELSGAGGGNSTIINWRGRLEHTPRYKDHVWLLFTMGWLIAIVICAIVIWAWDSIMLQLCLCDIWCGVYTEHWWSGIDFMVVLGTFAPGSCDFATRS